RKGADTQGFLRYPIPVMGNSSKQSRRVRAFPCLPALIAVTSFLVSSLVSRPAAAQATLPPALPEGVAGAVVRRAGLEGRVVWLDGTANLQRLSTREGVARIMDHCVRARVNTVVVDVKPLSGHVLFESKVAPKLREWRGFRYPAGYDLLRVALDEGHRRNLKVYANINVFSDGHKLVRSGPLYEKSEHQSIIYDVERALNTPRGERKAVAIGVNRGPDGDQISAYDPGYRSPRVMQPGEAFALVVADHVTQVADAAQAPPGGIRVPSDGYLLIGRGEGARWMLQGLRVGDALNWSAAERLLPILDAPSETVAAFVNPANPAMREYLLRVVDELATGYDLDGVVFDRMRYASLQSDFSEFSRQKFEEYLGQRLNRFPADIYTFDPIPGRPLMWGPYFKQWLEWRARNIRSWLQEASSIVRSKRPGAKVGVYVGSWYPTYYTVGVNWGSEEFAPGYDWMSPAYNTTGYAGLVDWISTGCYHPVATREQAKNAGLDDSYTVQAAAELSARAAGDVAFVYAGLYVLDYRGSPAAFREAIQAARTYSHGVMLFDLVHIEEYGWWNVLEEEFREPRTAPHDVPNLLSAVRGLRKALSGSARHSLTQ
ncbi:MAG TPA: alpha amylase family protein, partial [Armatimonadota bacterium]|nr:alpha amylase family protein [Armatimonadota bacterium]